MIELVIFRDLLEENSDHQYGLLDGRDEPNVICLCCGGELEYGDYEIIERVPWRDISDLIRQDDIKKEKQLNVTSKDEKPD